MIKHEYKKESEQTSRTSTIYVVGTPIGNLEDISQRALRILGEVDLILSEDTRVTKKLLSYFNITGKKLISYQDYTLESKTQSILSSIQEKNLWVALVSDAGTPCISDPGYKLIEKARSMSIDVIPIPGPCAAISLISVSGLPSDRFCFVGFLPTKKSSREAEFNLWKQGGSFIFYESPKRVLDTLEEISLIFPQSILCVGKELTKYFETIIKGPILEVIEKLKKLDSNLELKGEFCIMLYTPCVKSCTISQEELIRVFKKRLKSESIKDILSSHPTSKELPRKTLYQLLLDIKDGKI